MDPKKINYEHLASTVIKALNKRKMDGYYCPTSEEAVNQALELMNEGSVVTWGGSMTIRDIGLLDKIKKSNYKTLDRSTASTPEEVEQIYYHAFASDYYLMSSNAITLDGKLVNIDGNGNRVACLIYGPKNVIIIAGMNKVVSNEEMAIHRIKTEACPPNSVRLNINTPCAKSGYCQNCLSDDCICCQTVITRMSRKQHRIKVILVGESLGY